MSDMGMIDRAGAAALMPEEVTKVGLSTKPWSQFSAADYTDAQHYARSSLINLNTGSPSTWTKSNVRLPVYEPAGDLNRNAAHAAAARLVGAGGGVDAPAAEKKAAARRLVDLYGTHLKETPPDSIARMARG